MASCRDLPLLLLMVSLLLIRGSSALPTMSEDNAEDYSLEYDPTTTPGVRTTTVRGPAKRCDYSPCRENQIPCTSLSASSGCLCPGFTLHSEVPEAPDLKSVSWNGSDVVIHWCAPYSYVTSYIVTVGGKETQRFDKNRRSGGLGELDNVAQVCVVAVNDRGHSNESCMMYQPTDSSLPLKAGLIGGALGLLLLLLLAGLLWRHRRQRKQEASISMRNTVGAQ